MPSRLVAQDAVGEDEEEDDAKCLHVISELERRGSYAARIEVSGANRCPRSALCGKMRKENALIRAYLRIGGNTQ